MDKAEALARAKTLTLFDFDAFSVSNVTRELQEDPDGGYWIPGRLYVSKETLEKAVIEE